VLESFKLPYQALFKMQYALMIFHASFFFFKPASEIFPFPGVLLLPQKSIKPLKVKNACILGFCFYKEDDPKSFPPFSLLLFLKRKVPETVPP